jgi:pimeloyl-ACP methyl ester carboxylesterase
MTRPKIARRRRSSLPPALFVAGAAAGFALLVRWAANRAQTQHPPEGKFITVNGVQLHYTDTGGSGTPLVLLHGNGMTNEDWRRSGVTDKAAPSYRVIAFDRPGFGYSDRPRGQPWTPDAQAVLIHAALKQMGITQPVIVGHSWGALVAAAYAMAHPEALRGLVLISGYYFPTLRADPIIFSPPAIPILGDAFRYTVSPIIGWFIVPKLIEKMFAPVPVPERFSKNFSLPMAVRPWQIRAASSEAAMMVPAAAALKYSYQSIKAPTAIVAGNEDQIADVQRQSLRLHKMIPQSRSWVLRRTGHMPHYSSPGAVLDAIDFVAGRESWGRGLARVAPGIWSRR